MAFLQSANRAFQQSTGKARNSAGIPPMIRVRDFVNPQIQYPYQYVDQVGVLVGGYDSYITNAATIELLFMTYPDFGIPSTMLNNQQVAAYQAVFASIPNLRRIVTNYYDRIGTVISNLTGIAFAGNFPSTAFQERPVSHALTDGVPMITSSGGLGFTYFVGGDRLYEAKLGNNPDPNEGVWRSTFAVNGRFVQGEPHNNRQLRNNFWTVP